MKARGWLFSTRVGKHQYAVRFEKDYDENGATIWPWSARPVGGHMVADGVLHDAVGPWEVRDAIEDVLRTKFGEQTITERLEALTPGGSEFHDDPEACLRYLEARRKEAVEQVKRRHEVERQRDELLALCREVKDYLDHPEQRDHAAWELIGLLESALEDTDGK